MKKPINFEDFWPEENKNVVVPVDLAPTLELEMAEDLIVDLAAALKVLEPKPKRKNVNEGLWFRIGGFGRWCKTVPRKPNFGIYYDGKYLGRQTADFDIVIHRESQAHLIAPCAAPHTIKLKNKFTKVGMYYEIGRLLTLDDFEIVENPDYKGGQ